MRNISLPRGQRGIAEIISFMLVFSALFGFTAYVLVVQGRQAGMRASGLIDVMRDAQKRQNQLLSLTYSTYNGTTLEVYLFNYGSQGAEVTNVWVDGAEENFEFFYPPEVGNGPLPTEDNLLPSHKLILIKVHDVSPPYSFVLLTESNSLYSWVVG